MRKRIFSVILIFLTIFSLASCSSFDKVTDEDIIAEGYKCIVTFDANGGKIGNYDVRRLYCKENSYIFPPGENNVPKAVNEDVILAGWFTGTKDANGVVTFGDEFDFKNNRVTESITLYAKWITRYTVTIHYGENTKVINSDDPTKPVLEPSSLDWSKHTLLGYYADEECTIPYDWSVVPTYDDDQNANVYTKWIDGKYVIVTSATNLKSIKANTNLYFLNDVDMDGQTINLPALYTGTIVGNGYKLSNFTVNWTFTGTSSAKVGMFQELSNSTIKDITFDNVKINVTLGANNNSKVAIFAGAVTNTNIYNTKITNSTLTVTKMDASINVNESTTSVSDSKGSSIEIDSQNNQIVK